MNENRSLGGFLRRTSWMWVLAGCLIMWIVIGAASGNFNFETLQVSAFSASFVVMVALGQMLVVTTGRGAMDLSIPGVITLAAYLNMVIINGRSEMLLPGILAIILVGVVIGLVNRACVTLLKIPPMIATMAVNYIICSIALTLNSKMGLERLTQSEILLTVAREKIFGIYIMIFVIIAIVLLVWFLLRKTTYGSSLIALGQNDRAAYFAGIPTRRVEVMAYVMSAVLGSLAGLLISVRVGGAFLGMGDSYLMETVAGVVLGGTLMSGGKPNAVGTVFGCLFLTLIVTGMQVANFSAGLQNVIKGILIVAVIIVGTPSRKKSEQI